MRIKLRKDFFEKIFLIFSFFHVSDALAFRSLFMGSEGSKVLTIVETTPLDPLMGATRYLIILVAVVLAIQHRKSIIRRVLSDPCVWLLILLAVVSVNWSSSPVTTQKSSLFLFGWSLLAAYFSARYTLQGQLKTLAQFMMLIISISVLFTLLLPGSGIESGVHAGAIRGIFYHKNSFGRYMSFAILTFVFTTKSIANRKLIWIMSVSSVLLLALSTSRTPVIILLFLLLILQFYKTLKWDTRLFTPLCCTLIIITGSIISWLTGTYNQLMADLGFDPSLSGRTYIWLAVSNKIKQRPFLGYGFNAFWENDILKDDVSLEAGFTVVKSHHGFFDLSVELGILGILLFMISFFLNFRRSIELARLSEEKYRFWPIIYLTFFLLINQMEGPLLSSSFYWVIYLSTTLSLKAEIERIKYRKSVYFLNTGDPNSSVKLKSNSI